MDIQWRPMLWAQFGAAIDMLDNALVACPDSLWRQIVWPVPEAEIKRPQFWYVAYHALFWLDLYLYGSEEGFAPPAPFAIGALEDPDVPLPDQPYSREELRGYLASLREKCRTTIETMTDERARQPVEFPWMSDLRDVSYVELQMYSMRHIQEHAAQLSLLLGQHCVDGEQLDWVPRARKEAGGR